MGAALGRLGLFSVSYAGLWGQAALDASAFVRKAAALGFDSVLIMAKRPHLSPVDADEAKLGAIEEALRETGMACIGLAAYDDILLPAPAEVPALEMQLLYLEACARIAARLFEAAPIPGAAPLLRVFTGYSRPEIAPAAAWARTVAFLREAAALAARHGVTVAVQNHHDLAVGSEALLRLIEEVGSPNLRVGFDAWSPFLRGEDLAESALAIGDKAAISIAADYAKRPRWAYAPELVNYRRELPDLVEAVEMGKGEIDYPSFFAALDKGGFRGPVVYEMCSPIAGGPSEENLDAKARAFLDYMRGQQGGRK
ncbi:MAG TPA: sugar phosphate isomerase/epimerase family protein [Rectinemataceae bacterium]|nr:sugar phosphate isomerase/epimerase family protein [Rectinemataceae bacterium]